MFNPSKYLQSHIDRFNRNVVDGNIKGVTPCSPSEVELIEALTNEDGSLSLDGAITLFEELSRLRTTFLEHQTIYERDDPRKVALEKIRVAMNNTPFIDVIELLIRLNRPVNQVVYLREMLHEEVGLLRIGIAKSDIDNEKTHTKFTEEALDLIDLVNTTLRNTVLAAVDYNNEEIQEQVRSSFGGIK